MENFEKKIIKVCKENDVRKFFVIVKVVLLIACFLGIVLLVPGTIMLLIMKLIVVSWIIEDAAQKIKRTDEKVFYRNNFFYIIFSDKLVCGMIYYLLIIFGCEISANILVTGVGITTSIRLVDVLVIGIVLGGGLYFTWQIAKFFENKLK